MMGVLLCDAGNVFGRLFLPANPTVYFHSGFLSHHFSIIARLSRPSTAPSTPGRRDKNHGAKVGFGASPLDWVDAFMPPVFSPRNTQHLDEGGAEGDPRGQGGVLEILVARAFSTKICSAKRGRTIRRHGLRLRDPHEQGAIRRKKSCGTPTSLQSSCSFEILYELGRVYYENRHGPRPRPATSGRPPSK